MKKFVFALAAVMGFSAVANAGDVLVSEEPVASNPIEVVAENPVDYSFTIKVYYRYSSGKTEPYKSVKVVGQNSYGFTKEFYTNSDGVANISSVDSKLKCIYVNGKAFEGSYSAGNTYTFTIDD